MRFINHKNSTLTILNGNSTINLKPGDVSKSFVGTVKLVSQFINLGDSTELALVREGTVDDKVLAQCPAANRYVYDSVDNALSNMTVFHHGEHPNGITGESLNEIKDLRVKIEEQKEVLNNKELIITNLNKTIESLTDDKNYLNTKIETLNKEYQGYKSQVTIQISDLNRKLEASVENGKALHTTMSNLTADKTRLDSQVKDLTEKLANNQTKLGDAKGDNDEKDQAINGLMNQVKDLEDSKTVLEAKTIELNNEIKSLRNTINEKDVILESSKSFSEEIIAIKKELTEKSDQLDRVVADNSASKEVWNSVCQKFGITFEGGEWKCSYKDSE